MTLIPVTLLSVVAASVSADSGILYVAPAGNCNGASPCYGNVQATVDAAISGDEVRIAAGTYASVSARAGMTHVVYISKTITIRGGYTITNWAAPDPNTNLTVLDAQGHGRVFYIADGSQVTITGLNIINGKTPDGEWGQPGVWAGDGDPGAGIYNAGMLTLTNSIVSGNVTGSGGSSFHGGLGGIGGAGGGIYNAGILVLDGSIVSNNSTGDGGTADFANSGGDGGGILNAGVLVLRKSTVRNNITGHGGQGYYNGGDGGDGGGIHNTREAKLTLINAAIHDNTTGLGGSSSSPYWGIAGAGGGISNNSGRVEVHNSIINANTARGNGGGLYLVGGDAMLVNSMIVANHAITSGCGIYIRGGMHHLLHTTIVGNSGGDGSGLYITDYFASVYSTMALTNTILTSHTVGIYITGGNTVTVNGILWHNTPVTISQATTATVTVQSQYEGDPAFVAPDAGDYHIGSESAAIDIGIDAGVIVDIDGDPRPVGAGYDLGADELSGMLRVIKRAIPNPVQAGARMAYTIDVTNVGNIDLTVNIIDLLPVPITPGRTPGGTAIVPGGQITWTAHITARGGVWTHTFVVTVESSYAGPLTNVVRVATGETAVYTETSTVIVLHPVYLPLVLRNTPGITSAVWKPVCRWLLCGGNSSRNGYRPISVCLVAFAPIDSNLSRVLGKSVSDGK